MNRLLFVLLVAAPSAGRAEDLAALRAELHEPSEAKAVEAAQKLAEDASPGAVDAILDELAIGAPPKVEAELIGGLAARKDPRTFDVLNHYAQNRNSLLRKRAINALAGLSDPHITGILVAALSDQVADVRKEAARQLAARKEKSPAVEDALVKLLAHKDESAVKALGVLGGPTTARRLGELEGQIPDGLLAQTFDELLSRPDFGPDPLRVEVVKALGKLTGPEATAALKDYIKATDTDKTRPSRKEAKDIIEKRGAQDK
jgi:HEAT repeat protein